MWTLTNISALSLSARSANKTLGNGSCERDSHSIGLDTQKESLLALRRKPSAWVAVSGLVVTLCRGTTGLADGTAEAEPVFG